MGLADLEEMIISISKMEEMTKSGEWEQVHTKTVELITHTGNIINKTSGGWKDLLKSIKKNSGRNNTINL